MINKYIKKHLSYVDTRIGILFDFCYSHGYNHNSCIQNDAQLSAIIQMLLDYIPIPSGFPTETRHAIKELNLLIQRWDIRENGDIAGYIYQSIRNPKTRKKNGQFFTPPDIVYYLIDRAIMNNANPRNIKILDPSCGSGQFLIAAFLVLLDKYRALKISKEKALVNIFRRNLFGFDIDPIAILIAQYNLKKISQCGEDTELNVFEKNFIDSKDLPGDPVVVGNQCYKNFNYIIGNPPWGSALDREEKSAYKNTYLSAKSGINTFTLFMEKSLNILSDEGTLAFLIPEAFLNINAHTSTRRMLLAKTKIIDISLWGEQFKGVFAPSISLIVQKEKQDLKRESNIINITTSQHRNHTNTTSLIPQAYYKNTPNTIFNIHYNRKAVNLINRIEEQNCFTLEGRSKFFLGIVTGNNPKYLSQERSESFPDPIILGKDIKPYRVNFSGNYFKFNPGVLQQVAPETLYKTRNKLLYKFIGKKLVFALDREGLFSLNNVNGLFLMENILSPECLVSLINSCVMQYYYEKSFFTVKVLRGNLEKLPLKILSRESQRKIESLSVSLIDHDEGLGTQSKREEIEDIIFYEYGIKDRDAYQLMDDTEEAILEEKEAVLI